ncbi:MAG: sugar transferase [Anaerolineales bacterium]|nr:sugar transferase [Anaerolineales bacterium]
MSAAVCGLLLLAPLFLYISVLIKRDTPGPIFYWGPRIGRGGSPFDILKFRTMYERPQSYDGPKITGSGDPRITAVGQWLRDTKLNELPQLWNVLKGEMSLVGPRPEDPAYVVHWPAETQELLLKVRPGITSPASILYRDEEKMLDAEAVQADYLRDILPSKLRIDSLYVRHHRSVINDIDIIFWTLITLLPRLKQKRVPPHLLFWGPLSRLTSRYFSWFFIDVLVAFAAVGAAGLFWRLADPLDVGIGAAVLHAFLVALIFSLINMLFGLARIIWSAATPGYVLALFGSTALATAVLLFINARLPPPLPRGVLILTGILAWSGFVLVRYRTRLLSGAAQHWLNMRPTTAVYGERVLIIGAGNVGCFAASILRSGQLLPKAFSVIGMVDDDPHKIGAQLGDYRVVGDTAAIPHLTQQYDIGLLVFAIAELAAEERKRILALCCQTSIRIIQMSDIVYDLKARFLNQPVLMFSNGSATDQIQNFIKEVDDLLASGQFDQARERLQVVKQLLALESS